MSDSRLKRWRKRRSCFHHDQHTGETWIRSQIIDFGRKMFWCRECDQTWFL